MHRLGSVDSLAGQELVVGVLTPRKDVTSMNNNHLARLVTLCDSVLRDGIIKDCKRVR